MRNHSVRVVIAFVGGALLSGVAAAAPSSPTAQYLITFETRWHVTEHPTDFPEGDHFSPFVGALHNANASFWATGQLASTGIRNVAELGDGTALMSEFGTAMGQGDVSAMLGSGGFFGGITPSTSTTFTATTTHPLLTVVSMLAPSPDWFTGLHDYNLIQDGEWVGNAIIDVVAYDAGTDSGASYFSNNAPTLPPQPIQQITGAPLENLGSVAPVLRIKLQRIDQPFCEITLNQREYFDGNTLSTVNWRFGNFGASDRAVESKVWVGFVGFDGISILNDGADGNAVFPSGLDVDYGSFPIFTIDSSFPRGTMELSCRLLDPVTGKTLSEGINEVEIR